MFGNQLYLWHSGPLCELLDAFPDVWIRKHVPAAILYTCICAQAASSEEVEAGQCVSCDVPKGTHPAAFQEL